MLVPLAVDKHFGFHGVAMYIPGIDTGGYPHQVCDKNRRMLAI